MHPSDSDLQFQRLWHAARLGDVDAAGTIFEQFRPFLLQLANEEIEPKLKQKMGGSDLVQQTFVEAGQSLASFEGDSAAMVVAWLRRILLNNIANLRRYYQTDKRNIAREVQLSLDGSSMLSLESVLADTSHQVEQRSKEEMQRVVTEAFANLPPLHQLVIKYRNEEGLQFEEIGKLMDRTADASRKLWARAVEALRAEINKRSSL